MSATISRKIALIVAIALLAGCSAARSADPSSVLLGTWVAPNAIPGKGFTSVTFNADKTALAAFKQVDSKRYYGEGIYRIVPRFKYTVSIKHAVYEWHADATHVWMNIKGQSSANELSYIVDAGTLTWGPDEATQSVMHRE